MVCPITKEECIKDKCEWWSDIYEDTCAVKTIEILLSELYDEVRP